ncbi:MAG TPA: flagellar biosynthesis protein FlhF [Phycisphaerales bacterium]|nr:flagellar biosynthesis protein FlhF [Phycisphaerales bacterium]
MKLRTYQAYTMAEALAAVKRDLGAGAVILNTRTFKRGGLLGIGRKTIIEVTATPQQAPEKKHVPQSANPTSAAAKRAYGKANASLIEEVGEIDRERTRKLAIALAEKFARDKQQSKAQAPVAPSSSVAAPSPKTTVEKRSTAPAKEPTARGYVLTPTPSQQVTVHAGVSAEPVRPAVPPAEARVMQEELAAIRSMVGQVLQRQTIAPKSAAAMPARLFDMYLKLIAQDMSEELADRIVSEVRNELSDSQLDDEASVRNAVLRRLSECIPVGAVPVAVDVADGRPLTIALVGPTGVGKTTTIAKLAASYKLRHGRNVGLITSDTYRIAAVDQLRTYANIIGLPLQVALTPTEMRQAIHALRSCDVILIDTAGRSQNDSDRLAELREFVAAAAPHEVHLVLSGTAGERVLLREAEAFSAIGIHKIVLTKLDEAVSFGMLVDVVRRIGKQLSFVTTGQEVPDHIEVGRPER